MINKTILIGNCGGDPETKTTAGDVKVSTFSFATTEHFKNKDGEKESVTQWHLCECWKQTAEFVEKYVRKGHQLYIEGSIRYDKYQDSNGVEQHP